MKADKKKVSRVAQERRRENESFSIRSGKEAGIRQVSTILQKIQSIPVLMPFEVNFSFRDLRIWLAVI